MLACGPPAARDARAATAPSGLDTSASAEALLARGISHSGGSALRLGLEELRTAARKRPRWRPASEAVGVALLRAGDFKGASDAFSNTLGRALADSLSRGSETTARSLSALDENALFGLAVSRQFEGKARQAERLYRTYANLVGPTSKRAGWAYYRMYELFSDQEIPWGDPVAERQKAEAVDPDIASETLLPVFPDAREVAGLKPYLAPITRAGGPGDTLSYGSLPELAAFEPPENAPEVADELERASIPLRILVGSDGLPERVEVEDPFVGKEDRTRIIDAVMKWRFTPATADGRPTPAEILYGEPVPPEKPGGGDVPNDTTKDTGGRAPLEIE
jgi:hypothetical protein